MILDGTFTFNGPRATVWELLQDPDVLAKALPGHRAADADRRRTATGRDEGQRRPGHRGEVRRRASTLQRQGCRRERFTMQIDGKGGVGFTKGTASIALSEQPGRRHADALHVGRAGRRQDRRGRAAAARVGRQDDDAAGARGARAGAANARLTERRARVKPAPFEYFRPRRSTKRWRCWPSTAATPSRWPAARASFRR